jgi:hypothetical protein
MIDNLIGNSAYHQTSIKEKKTMAKREWCSQLWNLLLYLESAYRYFDKEASTRVRPNVSWGVSDDESEAEISFNVTRANQHGNYLIWIGLWMIKNEQPRKNCPIWVQLLKYEEGLWEKIKNEFNDPLVIIDEDQTAVGLPWLLSEDASKEDVKAAGEKLANHIINVLAIIPPDDMNNN